MKCIARGIASLTRLCHSSTKDPTAVSVDCHDFMVDLTAFLDCIEPDLSVMSSYRKPVVDVIVSQGLYAVVRGNHASVRQFQKL